jgi:YfiH family protein
VKSVQTHTTNVHQVTKQNRKDVLTDIDGLITNEPGICLVTSYADCVPLFFLDPVHKSIGLSHSGWRGTVGKMGKVTLKRMWEAFGTRAEDVLAAIGPSICQDCYEVSEDVILAFSKIYSSEVMDKICYGKGGGKYQLDLWKANYEVFLEAGILPEHIAVTDICTCCNPTRLFSHRASHGLRGNLAAFLALKQ